MSMMARFIAITPDQLAMIKDTPEMVAGVFAPDAGRPFESSSDLLERLRRKAPQLVADMLERLPPAVRQQLQRQLGLGENGLPNPRVGDAVRCRWRSAKPPGAECRRRPGPPATASRSTRRGTAFITCYAARLSRSPARSDRPCSAAAKSARIRVTGRRAIFPPRRLRRLRPLSRCRALSGACAGASTARR
jgi:hypothetical protein